MASDADFFLADKTYQLLEGRTFYGTYIGLIKNEDFETCRAVFEVDSKDPKNAELLEVFSQIRKENQLSTAKIWGGFTPKDHYKNNNYEFSIWAPEKCALKPTCKEKRLQLKISRARPFTFQPCEKRDYQVGVNIWVHYDSFKALQEEYSALEGLTFKGRYLGCRRGYLGRWRPIYEVDPSEPFNAEIVRQFDAVRESWHMDGRIVLKGFTDKQDSFAGKGWKLWIWAKNRKCLRKQLEEIVYTIKEVELEDRRTGRYGWRANIKVSG